MGAIEAAGGITVAVLWGLNLAMGKVGLAGMPPLALMAVRFGLVALLLCPFRPLPHGKRLAIAGLSVSLGSAHFSFLFLGLAGGVDAGTAGVLLQMQVPFAAVLAALVRGERLSRRGGLGLVIAFAGVGLLLGEPRVAAHPWAAASVLCAAFAFACSSLQIKAVGPIDSLTLSGWSAAFAAPQLVLLSGLIEPGGLGMIAEAGAAVWGALAYMVLGVTIGSYLIWYPLMRRFPVNQVMPFTFLVPVFAMVAGALILGEPISLMGIAGAAVTIAGVAVLVAPRRGSPR